MTKLEPDKMVIKEEEQKNEKNATTGEVLWHQEKENKYVPASLAVPEAEAVVVVVVAAAAAAATHEIQRNQQTGCKYHETTRCSKRYATVLLSR
jgi:hypothetical protein